MNARIPILENAPTLSGLLAIATLVLIAAFVLIVILSRPAFQRAQKPVLAALVLDSAVLVAYVLVFGTLRPDEPYWHQAAAEASYILAGESAYTSLASDGKRGYAWIAGTLYFVFGRIPLVLILTNLLLHSLIIVIVMRSADLLAGFRQTWSSDAPGRWAAWISAVAPGIVLWAPQVMRETLSTLCVAVVTLAILKYLATRKFHWFLLALTFIALLTWVRSSVGLGLAGAVTIALVLYAPVRGRTALLIRPFAAAALGAAVLYSSLQFELLERLSGDQRRADMQYLSTAADSGYGSGELSYAQSTWFVIVTENVPRSLVGPFPWEMSQTPAMLLAAADALVWLPVLATAVMLFARTPRSVRRVELHGALGALLVVGLVMTFVLASGISNYGMLARLRPTLLPVLIPMAAVYVGSRLASQRHESAEPRESLLSCENEAPPPRGKRGPLSTRDRGGI